MINLKNILLESQAEKVAIDFLSKVIKKSPFKGKVYVAGGAVRDMLLNLDPKDIDLVISINNGGEKFATWITKKYGVYKKGSNPVVFPKFGTAKFQLYGIKYKGIDLSNLEIEAVMTRTEKYVRGSRNPEVSVGTLKQDVERRDFTVNSLLKDLTTGEILDLTGMGKSDIKKGIIRTPLNPDVIFMEDPLRILRAIRFSVKYNWKLPLFMIRSIKKNSGTLKTISMERIRDELDKMLLTKYPDKAIKLMRLTNILKYVMPELIKLYKLKQNKYHKDDALGHTLEVLKNVPPKLTTRLSALFHDIGKAETKTIINNEIHFYEHEKISADIAKIIMNRLKYPNNIINAVGVMIKNHMRTKSFGDNAVASDKALRKLKVDLINHLEDTLDLIDSDNKAHSAKYAMPNQVTNIRARLKDLDDGSGGKIILPVNGNDIMKRFNLKPGPKIGKIMNRIRDAWFENPNLTKKDAYLITKLFIKKEGF